MFHNDRGSQPFEHVIESLRKGRVLHIDELSDVKLLVYPSLLLLALLSQGRPYLAFGTLEDLLESCLRVCSAFDQPGLGLEEGFAQF